MSGAPQNADGAGLTPLQRAFIALEETRARLAAVEAAGSEPIAIIGLGCRVPGGGNDAASFWRLMRDGVDAIGPLPADRWDVAATYDPDPDAVGRIAALGGGFVGDIRGFDAGLFGVARREAQGMDPQQRLLLEVAWEALENAGQAPDRLEGTPTGVYVGVTGSDYAYLQLETRDQGLLDTHFASGIAHSIASGRLSYLLGLQGPALTIDTACSSSLVAIHLACQALRAGDCRMALAGGVNLILGPEIFIALSRSRMLAPDGRCKTFDAAADGFARGEGCGVVVLKRLSQAQADGDRILAVVRGSALNQDGPSSGLTAPNGPAQEAVIRAALARAGVTPRQVGYIEAHGTGTQLGDPLEVSALGAVFGGDRVPDRPLLIGSVKTNVGHLEAAAGVTGLIKLVLSLQQRQIPPHLHFRTPSPHIAWDDWPVQVPTRLVPWEPIEGRRIAGVSSFGFSGTNAHVVLEEAPAAPVHTKAAPRRHYLFVLSSRDTAGLAAMAGRYLQAFAHLNDEALADVCFSAAAGRAQLPERAAIVVASMTELRERLAALAEGRTADGLRSARVQRRDPPRIAFLYTGQGAQYAGMVQRLDADEPVFHAALDRCAAVLDKHLPRPLREVLSSGETPSPLDATGYTQPALFAVEYALTELWRSWGVEPDVLIGHSVGEVVAACVGGVLTLPDALALIAARGGLMQALPAGGAMAAIFAPAAAVTAAVSQRAGDLAVAAHNGPEQTVVSGSAAAVDAMCAGFAARGVRCQRLPVSHAFHSPLVEPMLDAFEAQVAQAALRPPTLRIVSNLTGALVDPREVVQPRYWRRHVREPVRFAEGMRTLAGLRPDVCLEVGPHPTLLTFAEHNLAGSGAAPVLVASLRKGKDDQAQLAEALGALFLSGAAIDWRAVWRSTPARWVDLPGYAFQREPCWFPERPAAQGGRDSGHPLLGTRLRSALRDVLQFEQVLRADVLPYLADHRVQGQPILPATGFIELALAAGQATFGRPSTLHDLALVEPLRFADDETRVVQAIVRRTDETSASVEILSCRAGTDDWQHHAEGRLLAGPSEAAESASLALARENCREPVDIDAHHAQLAARGLDFGPSLRGLQSLLRGQGEALGEVHLPAPAISGRGDYLLHPALLDACLQVMNAALPDGVDRRRAYLPLAIGRVERVRAPIGPVWAHARVHGPDRSGLLRGEVMVHDASGLVATLAEIALRAAPGAEGDAPFYELSWPALPPESADWMPDPAALHAAVGPRFAQLAAENRLDAYQDAFVALEGRCADWIAAALGEIGWEPVVGAEVQRDALADQLGIVPRYRRLLARFLDILAEDGILQRVDGGWRVRRVLPRTSPAQRTEAADTMRARHPESLARITLSQRCGDVLAGILRGTVDPLQRLFPGGSSELAESLYRDAPEARAWNQLLRDAVVRAAATLPAGCRLRVLEVGGGTGGSTAWLAPALPADRCEYLFTDVGPSLVERARAKFGDQGFMDFRTFDLEHPAGDQGLVGQRFDLIVAANVVHATADLRETLGRLRDLLAPGGMLLMLEVAGMERWIDITFGLTEGWWRFRDNALRTDYPLLSRTAWLDVLGSLDLEAAVIGDEDARTREVLLAARRPLVDAVATSQPAGSWLIVGDGAGVAAALAGRLEARGDTALLVDGRAAAAELEGLVQRHATALRAVIHLGALDLGTADPDGSVSLLPVQQQSLAPLLSIVQALGACSFATDATPRLCLATRGAVAVDPTDGADALQAPVLGLGRVIALEHPELRCLRIDLDGLETAAAQADALLARLQSPSAEDQLARRGGGWHKARLTPARVTPEEAPRRLERGDGGTFDDLQLRPVARRAPGQGEIEIRVVASGLNFRDVMNAVALRDDPEPLGGECAGRIVAIGDGVTGFALGDHVLALAEASFADYATTPAALVRPIPAGISFAEAATLPFAFMTADHALHDRAGIKRGETVLIHAGAGGVGMAAIQLAQAAGATIIATAGSEAKRERLRRLGIAQVLDSRSLDFEAGVRELTGGRGVDVVLNSLAGEFIGASVRCLTADGRFLEIGKRDIWSAARFAEVRPGGRYDAIDLAAMRYQAPDAMGELFDRVLRRVAAGELHPLPLHTFPLERASEAFRFMAMARHVGKVVLTGQDRDASSLRALDPRAAYLVTGGLSGLGLLTAQRLAERGARHLVLVGRRAAAGPALDAIAALRADGVEVLALQADISRADEVSRVLAAVPAHAPLRGIVHSAGLLSDGALLQQEWSRFAEPFGPKVDGTWALHRQTRGLRLDFFVMYSSVAATLGSSGQGNHAAANAFMDALASERRAAGLPALAIAWGAWSDVGAAADRGLEQGIDARGLMTIAPQRGLDWLEALMASSLPEVAVLPVRWADFLAQPQGAAPLFDALRRTTRRRPTFGSALPTATATGLVEQLRGAAPGRRHELLLDFVAEHVARVIGASSAASIDPHQPLNELGLDSLMAVELRNRLGTGLRLARSLPATLVFDHPTLDALALFLGRDGMATGDAPSEPTPVPADAVEAIDELSDDEIERLFAQKMPRV